MNAADIARVQHKAAFIKALSIPENVFAQASSCLAQSLAKGVEFETALLRLEKCIREGQQDG